MGSQKEIKRSKTKKPMMTHEERIIGARGFVVVNNANPLPTGSSAYKLIVNEPTVITAYEERKPDGAGNKDQLSVRKLTGITLATLVTLTPPKHNPCSVLEVSSGSIICYLEDAF